jgi:hypothetical protein
MGSDQTWSSFDGEAAGEVGGATVGRALGLVERMPWRTWERLPL